MNIKLSRRAFFSLAAAIPALRAAYPGIAEGAPDEMLGLVAKEAPSGGGFISLEAAVHGPAVIDMLAVYGPPDAPTAQFTVFRDNGAALMKFAICGPGAGQERTPFQWWPTAGNELHVPQGCSIGIRRELIPRPPDRDLWFPIWHYYRPGGEGRPL